MKWAIIAALLVLSVLPVVQGQTADSARVTVCAPPYPVVSSASTGAGFINFCVYYPESVQPGESFGVTGILTAPTTVLPVFTAANSAFGPNGGGCTETTPTALVPTSNGVVGTQWTVTSGFTMSAGSERCDFIAAASLTVAAVPMQIYTTTLTLNVRTENVRVDSFNFLCDAPAIVPNAYSTSATTCNDPNLALTGTLTLSGIPDTQQEIQAIADALTAGLDVTICPQATPCYHVLSGAIDTNTTVEMGNQTVSFPSNLTVAATFPGDVDSPGFDFWALFIFWAVLLGICLYMGWWFAAGFAVPGLLDAMFPAQIPETFAVWFVFVLIGVVMEAAAAKFSWGPYKSRNRRGIMS